MPLDWGPWTVIKLDALGRYFRAFTIASKRASRTLYVDLFGGRPENRSREPDGRVFPGSAMRAASTTPSFSRLVVSELDTKAAVEQRTALATVAGSRAVVLPGDCNQVIPHYLSTLGDEWRWAPTFALVDQFSAEVEWNTLRQLATFKHPQCRTKAEIFMLVAPAFNVRGIRGPSGKINRQYAGQIDRMFGTPAWRMIMAARDDEVLSGAQARDELVNLMRWRLVTDLGYSRCIPLKVVNTAGRPIFELLFATDHFAGEKIMSEVFEIADRDLKLMVAGEQEMKKRATGQDPLDFTDVDAATQSVVSPIRPPAMAATLPPHAPFEYSRVWELDLQPEPASRPTARRPAHGPTPSVYGRPTA